jgi:hypothetical protein
MKKLMLALTLATAAAAGPALASEKCSVPQADWQPQDALEAKLKGDGWDVRSVKIEDGCYEAYAIDKDGNRVEAYFNPQTLARVDAGIADSDSDSESED